MRELLKDNQGSRLVPPSCKQKTNCGSPARSIRIEVVTPCGQVQQYIESGNKDNRMLCAMDKQAPYTLRCIPQEEF